MTTTRGWFAVYELAEAKIAREGWSLDEFYERVGISDATYRKMAQGVPLKRRDKIRSFERGMGWEAGSAAIVAAGGEPVLAPTDDQPGPADDISTLLRDLRTAINDGRNRDAQVTSLTESATRAIDLLNKVVDLAESNADRLDRIELAVERLSAPVAASSPRSRG